MESPHPKHCQESHKYLQNKIKFFYIQLKFIAKVGKSDNNNLYKI